MIRYGQNLQRCIDDELKKFPPTYTLRTIIVFASVTMLELVCEREGPIAVPRRFKGKGKPATMRRAKEREGGGMRIGGHATIQRQCVCCRLAGGRGEVFTRVWDGPRAGEA